MNPELIRKYEKPVPRYTSYPTAPHFKESVGVERYDQWLGELQDGVRLSLYSHFPFCDQLCWFCGCNTKLVSRYEPVSQYLTALISEMENVAARIPKAHSVCHLHWGGGSPDSLAPDDIVRVGDVMADNFHIADDAEFAVEVDPRGFDPEGNGLTKIKAFMRAGVSRVSIGVQDFDPQVQSAINRIQSFEQTHWVIETFRENGVSAINIDLIYGLPHQTQRSIEKTVEQVITLAPSRIALFGYAHLPSRLKRQRLIEDAALPDGVERFAQAKLTASLLCAAGYEHIGLDHFALVSDPLFAAAKAGRLQRNFQGYTSDNADALIGFGASSIGALPQGFVQNAVGTGQYQRMIETQGLAAVRGFALSHTDRARAFVIQKLMCDLEFSRSALSEQFGADAPALFEKAMDIVADDSDGLVEAYGDGFRVTERGRPFLRTICANFDAYFGNGKAQHSSGV